MIKHFFTLLSLALFLFVTSCNHSQESPPSDRAEASPVLKSDSSLTTHFIAIPSPDELFSFMKDLQSVGKSTSHLNDIAHYPHYINTKAKALNFGVYASDFLYCSTFDYTIEAVKYFTVVRKLGDDLGIGSAISQEAMERIKNNIGKNDSLTSISNSVYFTSVAELEKIDKASTLALVIAGGWIESLYLTTQMIPAYDSTNPAILRIAEQKYTLNNLLNYLSNYAWEHAIAEVITPLAELNSLYEELKEEHINSSLHRKNGKKILSGGSNVLISEGQYALICKKIASIHDQFISGN